MIVVFLFPCASMHASACALVPHVPPEEVHAVNLNRWDGNVIREVGHRRVVGVFANGNPSVAAAFAAAGIHEVAQSFVPSPAKSVAIYCPGPSLASVYSGDAISIAVNRAAEAIASDYWLCLDPPGFDMFPEAIPPRICRVSRECIAGHKSIPLHRATMPHGAGRFSMTAAVVFAWKILGAERIEIFGADLEGTRDFHGEIAGGRSDDRWRMERETLAALMADMPGIIWHRKPAKVAKKWNR